MKPSEVRDYIGRQHVQLRILFTEVQRACRDVLDGQPLDARPLIETFVRAVLDHLTIEDRILVPALRELDAWGATRALHVAVEHAGQRAQLTALRTLSRSGDAAGAARAADQLIAELLVDMDGEERDLLGPDLLRDDVVVIDQSDG